MERAYRERWQGEVLELQRIEAAGHLAAATPDILAHTQVARAFRAMSAINLTPARADASHLYRREGRRHS
jgi:hypothetical protein